MRIGTCNYVDADGNRCHADGTVKVTLRKRGGRNACFCEYHANLRQRESYFAENSNRKGTETKAGVTESIELETHGRCLGGYRGADEVGKMELIDAGFIPTEDSTVDIEFKSPIWEGLTAPSHVVRTVEHLLENRHISIDGNCGTHFHVGIKGEHGINASTMEHIRTFCNSLFAPLSDEMLAHPTETTELFGRAFGESEWATPIDMHTRWTIHTNFINMEHNPTLEFRLCKFTSAKQYQKLMKMCVEMTKAVCNTFNKHYDDTETQRIKYSRSVHPTEPPTTDVVEYHYLLARDTAQKLVNIYLKNIGC